MGAVEVLGLEIHGDPGAHALAVNYFDDLKSSPFAHQVCMELLTMGSFYDDHCKHFCLNIIRNFVRDTYDASSSTEIHDEIKNFLINYMQVQLSIFSITRLEEEQVRKLAAEIFSMVCFCDYPTRWNNFIRIMAGSVHTGSKAVQHYLDVMTIVSDSIASPRVLLPEKSQLEVESIVQYIEECDIEVIFHSFSVILEHYGHSLVNKCLQTITSFVQWIDVSHLMKHTIHKRIALEIDIPETRDYAAMCYTQIITHFKTEHKWRHRFLDIVFTELFILHKDKLSTDYDVSFAVRISTLLNAIGVKLVECYRDASVDVQISKAKLLEKSICSKFSHVISFIKDSNNGVSSEVVPFAKTYMKLLSEKETLRAIEMRHVQSLLRAVLVRSIMSIRYKFSEDETKVDEDDEFSKYRKTLLEVIERIFLVNKKVVFDEMRRIILSSLVKRDWREVPFNEAEYPVYLLGIVGSLFIPTQDGGDLPPEYEDICNMFRSLVSCGVLNHPHVAVTIQYFATLTSKESLRFFETEPTLVQDTLWELLRRGVHHKQFRVRCKCAASFADFFKRFSHALRPNCAKVFTSLQEFLELPETNDYFDCVLYPLSRCAQLRAYEAAAIAVTSGELDTHEQSQHISYLVLPAMRLFANSFGSWSCTPDHPLMRDNVALAICHGITVITMITNAFEDHKHLVSRHCKDIFMSVLHLLQGCAVQPMFRADVHDAMVNFMRRMLVCLDDNIIQFLPNILCGHLLHCTEAKCVIETSDLLIDIVYKLKLKVGDCLKRDFGVLICHVFDNLTTASEEAPTEERRNDILENRQISLLSILLSLRDNGLLADVVNELEIYYILKVFYMIALEAVEGQVRKYRCNGFNLLMHLIKGWDSARSKLHDESVELVYNFIAKTSFRALKEVHENVDNMDEEDYDNMFFHSACLLKVLYNERGKKMILWLAKDYLPSLDIPITKMVGLIQGLKAPPEGCTIKLKEFFNHTHFFTLSDMPSFAEMFI